MKQKVNVQVTSGDCISLLVIQQKTMSNVAGARASDIGEPDQPISLFLQWDDLIVIVTRCPSLDKHS